MLTILATATDERLTTLENAKEALALTDSRDDEYLKRLILRASNRVTAYLNRPLALQTYQALLPAFGGVNLQLPRTPVRAVLNVFDGSDTGASAQLTATGYRLDPDRGWLNRDEGWTWTRQMERGALTEYAVPNGEYLNWLVKFSAGYVLPGGTSSTNHGVTSTGSTLPGDLEDACLELVRSAYLGRTREDAVQSESVGTVSVTYRAGSSRALPESVAALLEPYRSVI